jgi:regulator of sigma D
MVQVLTDRRTGSQQMVAELLKVRERMLALYGELARQQPFGHDRERILDLLEQFCQTLIDYTADAHFRLYRHVDERRERRRAVAEVAERVYGEILATTDTILLFNDRYDFSRGRKALDITNLEQDLSQLGERLADRIELEDQIIAALGGRSGMVERRRSA